MWSDDGQSGAYSSSVGLIPTNAHLFTNIASIPEQSETYIVTICRELGHSHQIITSEHGGTETAEKTTVEAARAVHWGAVVSARSGETEDVTIVHLAVGWGVLQLKVGSFSRSERMAKWNEALRIEEALDGRARFAGAEPWRGWVAT